MSNIFFKGILKIFERKEHSRRARSAHFCRGVQAAYPAAHYSHNINRPWRRPMYPSVGMPRTHDSKPHGPVDSQKAPREPKASPRISSLVQASGKSSTCVRHARDLSRGPCWSSSTMDTRLLRNRKHDGAGHRNRRPQASRDPNKSTREIACGPPMKDQLFGQASRGGPNGSRARSSSASSRCHGAEKQRFGGTSTRGLSTSCSTTSLTTDEHLSLASTRHRSTQRGSA